MTRDVVALPEEADVAEAGRLMLERCIKSIPVVRGRRVVGIVARRDLLKALARSDHDIARELEALLSEQLGDPSSYRVVVRQGVAELTGPPDPIIRKLAGLLTRGIPGAVGVRFRPEGSGEPHNGPAGSRSGSSPSDAARGAPVDDEP